MSWEEREAKKSLSKLIKGEQNSLFRIESFEVEEIIQDPLQEESYQEKLARMEKEAYQKGFEQGQRDGLSLEEKQMGEKAKQLETIFVGLNDLKAQIYHETESELLQMSILMAKKIIREEIKTDGGIIRNTIQAALKFLVDKQHIRIRLNPEDMEETRKLLPELAAKILRVTTDPDHRQDNISKGADNVQRFSWRESALKVIDIYNCLRP